MANLNTSALLNDEVHVNVDIVNTTSTYVDLSLWIHSNKWSEIDIAIQYQPYGSTQWLDDASLGYVSNGVVTGNRVYKLKAAANGAINVVRWWYSYNNIMMGNQIGLRVNVLPRFASYSDNVSSSLHSEVYGNDFSTMRNASSEIILGKNQFGQLICVNGNVIAIRQTVNGPALYTTSACNTPKHICQLDNLNYLISDYGNNRVIELNETLTTTVRSMSILHPVFCDYNKLSDTILITANTPDAVREFIWSAQMEQWAYTDLNTPASATYATQTINKVVIADAGNNRVVLYDVLMATVTNLSVATLYADKPDDTEILSLNRPFRAFWKDENIYVVEETGKEITWNCSHCDQGACKVCDQGYCPWSDQGVCSGCDQGHCSSCDQGACTNCDQARCFNTDQSGCWTCDVG